MLPVLSGRELVKALSKLGYQVVRQRGSHMALRAPDRPPLTIPDHRELAPGTLRSILRAAGISEAELRELLGR